MKALFFITDGTAKLTDIDNTLEALQKAVGGYIETVTIAKDACLICNEEGRLLDLKPQNVLGMEFYGNVLLVGVKGDRFTDVPEGIIKRLEEKGYEFF